MEGLSPADDNKGTNQTAGASQHVHLAQGLPISVTLSNSLDTLSFAWV